MLNTYVKNRGITKTIIHNNNSNHYNEVNWDADYDGNIANVSLVTNTDGQQKHYGITLDNYDLEKLLTIPSINVPIHDRLNKDFVHDNVLDKQNYAFIELPHNISQSESFNNFFDDKNQYISSPKSNEEFIVPLTLNVKQKKHKKSKKTSSNGIHNGIYNKKKGNKTKKNHKAYKKLKSASKKSKKNKVTTSSSILNLL